MLSRTARAERLRREREDRVVAAIVHEAMHDPDFRLAVLARGMLMLSAVSLVISQEEALVLERPSSRLAVVTRVGGFLALITAAHLQHYVFSVYGAGAQGGDPRSTG